MRIAIFADAFRRLRWSIIDQWHEAVQHLDALDVTIASTLFKYVTLFKVHQTRARRGGGKEGGREEKTALEKEQERGRVRRIGTSLAANDLDPQSDSPFTSKTACLLARAGPEDKRV